MHLVRALMKEHGDDDAMAVVSVDEANVFDGCGGQEMLIFLVERVPSLARFVTLLYGGEDPLMAFGDALLRIREGTQQGDLSSMLLFRLLFSQC